jgi:hypothetical protein
MQAQNRKGVYVEEKKKFDIDTFSLSRKESEKILILNQSVKDERLRLQILSDATGLPFDYPTYVKFKEDVEEKKEPITEQREIILEEILVNLGREVNSSYFKVILKKGAIKWGKQLYITENTAQNYFALKQTQYNIKKSFDVKQSSRPLIVNQLAMLLSDNVPKVIVRTDIKEFYESISHEMLNYKVNENTILSYPSKKIIKDILNSYWNMLVTDGLKTSSDERIGIPRGVGISAYLSELYLKSFDNEVKALPNVTYYARYVDDIIVVFTPESRTETTTTTAYKNRIADLLKQKAHLNVNHSKTKVVDLRKKTSEVNVDTKNNITFLGYKFVIAFKFQTEVKGGRTVNVMRKMPFEIKLSDSRYSKYVDKIEKAFLKYDIDKSTYLKKANRELIKRVKYLTGNTRLTGNKDNVFTGVYFSNQHLSEPVSDLSKLDRKLKTVINTHLHTSTYLNNRLQKFSFLDGFKNKHFKTYKIEQLDKIVSIWK